MPTAPRACADKPVRRWFITGASSGLGRALTAYALDRGDHVTATVRRPAALDGLRDSHGDRLTVELLDVTHPGQVEEVIARTLAAGPVDIVVNNAGYAVMGAAEEMTVEQVRHQLETLLVAPLLITRSFLAPMREQGGGRVIQISSLGGQAALAASSAYHAAKWGLEGYSESVSHEVAGFGIHLTVVQPGATRTGFGSAVRYTDETAAYRDTPVGEMRRWVATADDSVFTGDPAKLAAAIYETTRQAVPPLRLTLGADAYEAVHEALTGRIAALEAQQSVAASVGFAD
ncbi:SDR family oxidoreductase [Streptomyces sp. NPDC047002]|uniref:SDR family oxidoreductase n=1 Tax=Streptomyces sp. NPDC047002 TaxID=3155475 RepID=UPI003454CA95